MKNLSLNLMVWLILVLAGSGLQAPDSPGSASSLPSPGANRSKEITSCTQILNSQDYRTLKEKLSDWKGEDNPLHEGWNKLSQAIQQSEAIEVKSIKGYVSKEDLDQLLRSLSDLDIYKCDLLGCAHTGSNIHMYKCSAGFLSIKDSNTSIIGSDICILKVGTKNEERLEIKDSSMYILEVRSANIVRIVDTTVYHTMNLIVSPAFQSVLQDVTVLNKSTLIGQLAVKECSLKDVEVLSLSDRKSEIFFVESSVRNLTAHNAILYLMGGPLKVEEEVNLYDTQVYGRIESTRVKLHNSEIIPDSPMTNPGKRSTTTKTHRTTN